MRHLIRMLSSLISNWRSAEETLPSAPVSRAPSVLPRRIESPQEELARMREARAHAKEKIKTFRTFRTEAMARDCEQSLHAIERRMRALEMNLRRAA